MLPKVCFIGHNEKRKTILIQPLILFIVTIFKLPDRINLDLSLRLYILNFQV